MRILSVKSVLKLAVNLHHVLSNGAAFTTQSRSSLTSYEKKTLLAILLRYYEIVLHSIQSSDKGIVL